MESIDQVSVQRTCRNAIALQQTLSSITATREVSLDLARNYYEMLYMDPEVRILLRSSFTCIQWNLPKIIICFAFFQLGNSEHDHRERCTIYRNATFKCIAIVVQAQRNDRFKYISRISTKALWYIGYKAIVRCYRLVVYSYQLWNIYPAMDGIYSIIKSSFAIER